MEDLSCHGYLALLLDPTKRGHVHEFSPLHGRRINTFPGKENAMRQFLCVNVQAGKCEGTSVR